MQRKKVRDLMWRLLYFFIILTQVSLLCRERSMLWVQRQPTVGAQRTIPLNLICTYR